MGEAVYHLAARFPTMEAAEEAERAFRSLLEALAPRFQDGQYVAPVPSPQQMRALGIGTRHQMPGLPLLEEALYNLGVSVVAGAPVLTIYGEVNHLTDWNPLHRFLRKHGALEVSDLSDESPGDALWAALEVAIGATPEAAALYALVSAHDEQPPILTESEWEKAREILRQRGYKV